MAYEVFLAKSFLDEQAGLSKSVQKQAVKVITQLQTDPMQGKLDSKRPQGGVDDRIWKCRVNQGDRLVFFWEDETIVVLHIGKHDPINKKAALLKATVSPVTGAARFVDVTEEPTSKAAKGLGVFTANWLKGLFESLGVPVEKHASVLSLESEDEAQNLCEELGEAGYELLTVLVDKVVPTKPGGVVDALQTEEGQSQLIKVSTHSELASILAQPLEAWIHFLHPSQRRYIRQKFRGPALIQGGAGTGKTVVAVHRAAWLARNVFKSNDDKILLTTYTKGLTRYLEHMLDKVMGEDPSRERVQVFNFHSWCMGHHTGGSILWNDSDLKDHMETAYNAFCKEHKWSLKLPTPLSFLLDEYRDVVWAQDIREKNAYLKARRAGRGTAIRSRQERLRIWQVFEQCRKRLAQANKIELQELVRQCRVGLQNGEIPTPFKAVIVDEAQDFKSEELRCLKALAGSEENGLLLCGDSRQRIYERHGLPLGKLGINVRGRSRTLRINYRTTRQIRRLADDLFKGAEETSLDGSGKAPRALSELSGPQPILKGFETKSDEQNYLAESISNFANKQNYGFHEMAIFAPTNKDVDDIMEILKSTGIESQKIGKEFNPDTIEAGKVIAATIHQAKGLEFKAVFVARLRDDKFPPKWLLKASTDELEKERIVAQHRRLLHVALTRARDALTVTWQGKPSVFIGESANN